MKNPLKKLFKMGVKQINPLEKITKGLDLASDGMDIVKGLVSKDDNVNTVQIGFEIAKIKTAIDKLSEVSKAVIGISPDASIAISNELTILETSRRNIEILIDPEKQKALENSRFSS